MFFNQQLSDRSTAATEAAIFDDVSAMGAAGYLVGLDSSELASIVNWNFIQNNTSVPEPSTLAIFALGMISLTSRRYKKQS